MNNLPLFFIAYFFTSLSVLLLFLTGVVLRQMGLLSSSTTRKLIHIGSGSLYVMFWPLFPLSPFSKYIAMTIPALFGIVVVFTQIKPKLYSSTALINTMSRNGAANELLKGPLIYSIVIPLASLFWTDSPIGIIAIISLCLGDGMADLIGSNCTTTIPSPFGRKTLGGSLSFLLFSICGSWIAQWWVLNEIIIGLTLLLCLIATFVEYISPSNLDNLFIVLAVISVGLLCG
ncbi:Dolichol kinase [Entamoeba marina]